MIFVLLIVCIICVLFARRFLNKEKRLSPLGTITMVTGAVKCGKSTLAVYLAVRSYKRAKIMYYIQKFIKPNADIEKPLLYSNIPLGVDYVPLTYDVILRKKRVAYKSVCLIDECSLLADSQLVKNQDINEQLLLFYKLWGHMSHGGTLVLDTQSIEDNHYAVKRCVNSYLYIYKLNKYLPFFLRGYVLEQRYSADGSVISTQSEDVENNLKRIWIPKKVWKLFDTYAYSSFTDYLPYDNDCQKADTLKTDYVLSLRSTFRNLKVPIKGEKVDEESATDLRGCSAGNEPIKGTIVEVVNEEEES